MFLPTGRFFFFFLRVGGRVDFLPIWPGHPPSLASGNDKAMLFLPAVGCVKLVRSLFLVGTAAACIGPLSSGGAGPLYCSPAFRPMNQQWWIESEAPSASCCWVETVFATLLASEGDFCIGTLSVHSQTCSNVPSEVCQRLTTHRRVERGIDGRLTWHVFRISSPGRTSFVKK